MNTLWRTQYFKTLTLLTATVLLASSGGFPLFAEDTTGGPSQEQRKAYFDKFLQEHPEMKAKLDTNGDGTVTPEEAKAGREKMGEARREHWQEMKTKADTNGDGKLSEDEKKAAKEQWLNNHPEMKAKLDTNGDGQISEAEKKAARDQWQEKKQERREEFKKKADTNGDGQLSPDERKAAREQWKANHPGQQFDRDNNPPGMRGGPGTNWENRPGPQGGPGASPDRRGGWFRHGGRR